MDDVLGIIGSGNIGQDVARLAAPSGLTVLLSNSRGPASIRDLATDLGPAVRAVTVANAIADADVVVLALPIAEAAKLSTEALKQKVVVDATNYYPSMFGPLDDLDAAGVTSSEFLQMRLPDARLVKALNNVDFLRLPLLARTPGAADRSALPVAADDPDAKAAVVAILDRLGFDAVDLGPLSEGWRSQPGTPVYVDPYQEPSDAAETDPTALFMNARPVPVSKDTAWTLVKAATRS